MQNYKKLKVWDKSHNFVLKIYKITSEFPKIEQYRLSDQLIRSSSSIPTNIAEGCGRASNKDKARFITIAIGSCSEAEYQLLLALDLNYLNEEQFKDLNVKIIEIRKMLYSFKKSLKYNEISHN